MKKKTKTRNQQYYCYAYDAAFFKQSKTIQREVYSSVKSYEIEEDKLKDFLFEDMSNFYKGFCSRRVMAMELTKANAFIKGDKIILAFEMEDPLDIMRITHVVSRTPIHEKTNQT
jgi:hypothetical protein